MKREKPKDRNERRWERNKQNENEMKMEGNIYVVTRVKMKTFEGNKEISMGKRERKGINRSKLRVCTGEINALKLMDLDKTYLCHRAAWK